MVAPWLPKKQRLVGSEVRFERNEDGVICIDAPDLLPAAAGQGYAHAHDRLAQMLFTRLAAQGRLGECLAGTEEAHKMDVFMRRLGLARAAEREVARCSPEARALGEAYCEGVNAYLEQWGGPLRLRVLGYKPEPWQLSDTLLLIKLMSYLGLAQGQEDVERVILQAVSHGVDPALLRRLFHPWLEELDDAAVARMQGVQMYGSSIPAIVRFMPAMKASNNWVVSGARSASGAPLFGADPHLEVNRLPAIWVEHVIRMGDDYHMGVAVPGMPGTVVGRTRHVAMSLTYGYMDMVDFFIEEVRDGACQRADGVEALTLRREVVARKGHPSVELRMWYSSHGRLEVDPLQEQVPDGRYAAMAYSQLEQGAAETLHAMAQLREVQTTQDAQAVLRGVGISANWLIADRQGNIGYQQSGVLPQRAGGGLVPLSGADPELAWQGVVSGTKLRSELNPKSGILATANDELNSPDGPTSVNLCMGNYRLRRIFELLDLERPLTKRDFERAQADLYSIQARELMEVIRPHLPDTPLAHELAQWDLCYDAASRGAVLFERVYQALLAGVFEPVFGTEGYAALSSDTSLLTLYFQYFDRVLLSGDEAFFSHTSRAELFSRILLRELGAEAADPPCLGEAREVRMQNIVFGGKLPEFMGLDLGPIQVLGSRSTLCQGGLFTMGGRLSSFAPSYRFVTDLAEDSADTILAGGPSGRPGSRWYGSEIDRWLAFQYKKVKA